MTLSNPPQNGDHRPNSGLREGNISHAEVNEALRGLPKTIIFGQQNRLRDGLLMEEDERLDRFHAGHDLVRFFYGDYRQQPTFRDLFYNEHRSKQGRDADLNNDGQIGPEERFNNFLARRVGNPYMVPEETTQFEMGFDWNFVGDYVGALTAFYKSEFFVTFGEVIVVDVEDVIEVSKLIIVAEDIVIDHIEFVVVVAFDKLLEHVDVVRFLDDGIGVIVGVVFVVGVGPGNLGSVGHFAGRSFVCEISRGRFCVNANEWSPCHRAT